MSNERLYRRSLHTRFKRGPVWNGMFTKLKLSPGQQRMVEKRVREVYDRWFQIHVDGELRAHFNEESHE